MTFAGPPCARCGAEIRAGDEAHGGQLEAVDGSFVALFELCASCDSAIRENEAARAHLHLQLREHLREALVLAGGGVAGHA